MIDDPGVVFEPVVEREPRFLDAARQGEEVGRELGFAVDVARPELAERRFFFLLPQLVDEEVQLLESGPALGGRVDHARGLRRAGRSSTALLELDAALAGARIVRARLSSHVTVARFVRSH